MVTALRPCLTCGRLARGSRCPDHARLAARAKTRQKRVVRPYTAQEQRRRAGVVTAWRDVHGDLCPGWGVPAHASGDLTADHPDEVALSGDESQPLAVLCRSCNSRKNAERQHATRRTPGAGWAT